MTPFAGELLGTALFVLLGNSVQANALLARTKAEGAATAWLLVATGWGLAYFAALAVVAGAGAGVHGGAAHLNPAVTLAAWQGGGLGGTEALELVGAQLLGAAIGAAIVFALFLPHWGRTEEPTRVLACFATVPAVRAPLSNLLGEVVGSFALVLGILLLRGVTIEPAAGSVPSTMQAVASVDVRMGALGAVAPALLLWVIALGVGGATSVGFNPARDFAPRVLHALLPVRGKGASEWSSAWIPVIGPLIGGSLAALAAGAVA